jgi:hypothetical protein
MATIVQEYLRQHGLEALQAQYAIKAKRHTQYPNLVLLKYSQIDSPMGEPIVQHCRGLILDEADDWRVVSWPYNKFFNYGEGHAANIDWSSARVYEKLDGSLISLYWYRGEWHMQTSGTPDGETPVYGAGLTFRKLFWRTWEQLGYKKFPGNPRFCCFFELMTPYNRVVVPHGQSRIVLHGARNLDTGEEIKPEVMAWLLGYECVKVYPLACFEECIEAARAINPMEGEGYIVCDADFNRVKVKSPAYVALSHLKDSLSPRRLLEIIRTNEGDEFLSYYPEWAPMYQAIKARYDALCHDTTARYAELQGIADNKAFALEATKHNYASLLFSLRKGSIASAREGLTKMHRDTLERIVGLTEFYDTAYVSGKGE